MRMFALLVLLGFSLPQAEAQWVAQRSGTEADLRAIHAVTEQVAWAAGAQGTVLRTGDGGATWVRCALPAEAQGLDFRGVQGFDATTAVAMSSGEGELSRVYRTTDGGKTWDRVFTNPNPESTLDAVQFQWKALPPPQKGYYARGVLIGHPVAGEFVIYTSKDHGKTWQDLRDDEAFSPGPPAVAREGELVFPESNTALTATADDDSFAFVTGGNGGARLLYPESHHQQFDYVSVKWTFSTVQLPIPAGSASGAFSIASRRNAADKIDLMVVGGDAAKPELGSAVFVPHAGALVSVKKLVAPRTVLAAQSPSGYRTAVAYESIRKEWITVGPNGTDVSGDDGRSWTRLSPGPSEPADADKGWQSISLPFAVGPHGRIGRLRESGSASALVAGR